MTEPQLRVCIIGGGVSGLTSIKACLEEGIEPVCFEQSADLGGLWNFTEKVDGKACVMRSTIINTSKEVMAFSDFPPPSHFANFMHNTKVMEYLRLYAEKFQLEKYIRFNTTVLSVKRSADYETSGHWNVQIKDASDDGEDMVRMEVFDAVMVCIGHHANPYKPHFEGMETFPGRVLHTHDYRDCVGPGYRDKRILVVGIGNSGGDIAVELSHAASQVLLSTRRGAWVFKRVGPNGLPSDTVYLRRYFIYLQSLLGMGIINRVAVKELNARFDHDLYRLRPNYWPFQQHPMVNDDLPNRILSGAVVVKSNVRRFIPPEDPSAKSGSVEFDDGTIEDNIDMVVLATGYTFSFPFLEEDIVNTEGNRLPLYKFVFPPGMAPSRLAFIGYVQPIGALQPLSEMQARWAVRVFKGLTRLPFVKTMERHVEATRAAMTSRYVASLRHTIQVDWIEYMDALAEEFGCRPHLWSRFLSDPVLAWNLITAPCTPYQFRLNGPHPWTGAREAILKQWDRTEAPLKTRPLTKRKTCWNLGSVICALGVIIVAYFAVLFWYRV